MSFYKYRGLTKVYRDTTNSWDMWALELAEPDAHISEWDAILSRYDVDIVPNYQLGGEYPLASPPRHDEEN